MARLAKHHVHAALEWAGQEILEAGGEDGIVSRRDVRVALESLSGVDRGLVDMFFRFIDHRDAKPGARVTKPDIDKAIAYAKAKLVDAYDLNRNGLSQDEIELMSSTGQLAVAVARRLKDKALHDSIDSGAELAERIEALLEGVVFDDFGTEGTTAGFTAVHVEASLSTLDEATLSATLGLDPDDPKQEIARFITDLDDFYVNLVELAIVRERSPYTRAHDLVALMQASLRGTVAAIIGRDGPGGPGAQHPAYIVGIAPDGDLVGLRTLVVWT